MDSVKVLNFRILSFPLCKSSRESASFQGRFLTVALFLCLFFTVTSSFDQNLYSEHCKSLLPSSEPHTESFYPSFSLDMNEGIYIGGGKILGHVPSSSIGNWVSFRVHRYQNTSVDDVIKITGNLKIRGSKSYNSSFSRGPHFHTRSPRNISRRGLLNFDLSGFYSRSSKTLCMIGYGSPLFGGKELHFSSVFKLNYPKNCTVLNSFVNGSLEIMQNKDWVKYSELVSVLAISCGESDYAYTMLVNAKAMCPEKKLYEMPLSEVHILNEPSICSYLSWGIHDLQLEYDPDCKSGRCSPFDSLGFLPERIRFKSLQCRERERAQFLFGFSNYSDFDYFNTHYLVPETTLLGEGMWDAMNDQFCMVGCRLINYNGSLGNAAMWDCSMGLKLQFPTTLTVRNRNVVQGHIWSNNSGYFKSIRFSKPLDPRGLRMSGRWSQNYSYTEIEHVRESCKAHKEGHKSMGRRYPDGSSFQDLRFDATIKNSHGEHNWVYFTPLFLGESNLQRPMYALPDASEIHTSKSNYSLNQLNVSYSISFAMSPEFRWKDSEFVEIAAEGIYDPQTGILCMMGCRKLGPENGNLKNISMDCEIYIHVQFSPLNPKLASVEHRSGTIKSTRKKKDPLYFEPLELSSRNLYHELAKESVWRKHLEVIMVLMSLSLASIFIVLQLLYVKKHPDVLPFASVLVLTVLTLGHMIPLVLNFEAFFLNPNRQNVLNWRGGWLEVNEVVVRLITMVAFLLQFRLLQVTWSAKSSAGLGNSPWIYEKKAAFVSMGLYLVGGLVSCFFHWKASSTQVVGPRWRMTIHRSIWEDLRSYSGLVLDGFLLPQVILNFIWDTKERALSPWFFIGTTLVRCFPHVYDAYRAVRYVYQSSNSYFYANPYNDFYSTAWDIVIPLGGCLLAILVFLQQRFGGRFFLPQRFRNHVDYQKVSTVGT
ncbi:uncharacterized protein LOC18426238 [Amborella trichopoda]|uniref:RING-type E3 ubiquitin transferase n=1 Tax=Amborella trichopoda TaxID=13333 RepID=W1NR14_AMBTC|nr:uncharacterized protein LOC18426238 [Amborella trichopoda]ERM98237.1 hypothetical protein AMTR_s00095p00161220 [Amborella trichopoda]|eukprot:XP_006832959.1 uncharacterized protein LOC18426238 [Amborella trichopoda]